MDIHNQLIEKVKSLPDSPGVYEFFDKEGKIIYIGKAKNLRKRVSSYFTKKHVSYKTELLVRKISDIKHIVVNTETDALLLENNLIKKFQPRYNVLLKDDKSFPWIVVKNERFPRVFMTRRVVRDGSKYYGPYTSVKMVRTLIDLFRSLFKIRTCNLNLSAENIASGKYKVCLEYHIGNCAAPCVAKQSEDEYNEYIREIHNILKGNLSSVIDFLREQMMAFADKLEFEKAQEMKEKIQLIKNYQSKSAVVSADIKNIDVFGIFSDDDFAYVNYLKIVDGRVVYSHTVEIRKRLDEADPELLMMGIADFYANKPEAISELREIVVPFELDFAFDNVKITVPKRGDKKVLVELSIRNAQYYRMEKLKRREKISEKRSYEKLLAIVKNDLRLKDLPYHIECFDNSNFQGTNAVSSCVVFRNGRPAKSEYRHFNVKTVEGINDFATMAEVVKRRYRRLIDERKDLPQLVIVDGGKGQLSAAVDSLKDLGIYGKVAVIGIAKRLEEIYFPEDSYPLYLDKNSPTLRLIQFARDEAHRFGIEFHRKKRMQSFLRSELNNINGIGEKSIVKLLGVFKSIDKIRNASVEELSAVVGHSKALIVYGYFHGNDM